VVAEVAPLWDASDDGGGLLQSSGGHHRTAKAGAPYCPFLPGPPSETKFPTRLNTRNNAKQSPLRSAECVPTVRLGARLNVTPRSRRAATLLYEATRTTTRQPSCSGAMPCYARVRGGRRGGDPSMACKVSGTRSIGFTVWKLTLTVSADN
jgi:hypothetical protein